jgi:hypothetical protein
MRYLLFAMICICGLALMSVASLVSNQEARRTNRELARQYDKMKAERDYAKYKNSKLTRELRRLSAPAMSNATTRFEEHSANSVPVIDRSNVAQNSLDIIKDFDGFATIDHGYNEPTTTPSKP